MTHPCWTVIELERGDWWAVDTGTGVAYSVGPELGERLWLLHALQRHPLAKALSAGPEQRNEEFVDLEFLGVATRYLCASEALAEQVSTMYAGMIPELRRSPDMLVRLGPNADFDRLHRAVPGERTDVAVCVVGTGQWEPGSAELPVIPALQSPVLTGRFCGVHGALLSTSRGGVLVCGERRAGKTSAALLAEHSALASVLGEELVLVDGSGDAVGVPLPVRERSGDHRCVRALPKAGLADQANARTVSAVVTLERAKGAPSWTRITSGVDRVRLIAPHIRVLGGPLGRAMTSVLKLLQGAEFWHWQQSSWPSLIDDLAHGFHTVLQLQPRQGNR